MSVPRLRCGNVACYNPLTETCVWTIGLVCKRGSYACGTTKCFNPGSETCLRDSSGAFHVCPAENKLCGTVCYNPMKIEICYREGVVCPKGHIPDSNGKCHWAG